MSVFFGFIILFVLPSSPERLRWGFSAAEKEIGLRRYREAFNIEGDDKIRGAQILGSLKDPKTWFYGSTPCLFDPSFLLTLCQKAVIFATSNVSLSSFGNFLPVLIKSFGFSTVDTNLLTIPVWALTACFIIATGIASDRQKKRGWLLMVSFAIASIGYIILLARPSQWVQFTATLFIGSGTYPQVTLLLSWVNSNTLGYTKRYYTSCFHSPI
jgi:hypothetical protein